MTQIVRYLSNRPICWPLCRKVGFWGTINESNGQSSSVPAVTSHQGAGHRFCTGPRRWESISGSGSCFANSWNLVILSLEKDLADIFNSRLGRSGGETDGSLLIVHTVKNYTVAPDQLRHKEKTNQRRNTSKGEIRTKGKSKPVNTSLSRHNLGKTRQVKNDFKQDRDTFALTQDKMQPWSDLVARKVTHAYKYKNYSYTEKRTESGIHLVSQLHPS